MGILAAIGIVLVFFGDTLRKAFPTLARFTSTTANGTGYAIGAAFTGSVGWLLSIKQDFSEESQNPAMLTVKLFVWIGLILGCAFGFLKLLGQV